MYFLRLFFCAHVILRVATQRWTFSRSTARSDEFSKPSPTFFPRDDAYFGLRAISVCLMRRLFIRRNIQSPFRRIFKSRLFSMYACTFPQMRAAHIHSQPRFNPRPFRAHLRAESRRIFPFHRRPFKSTIPARRRRTGIEKYHDRFCFSTRCSPPYISRSFGFSILPVGFRGTSAKMMRRGRL